MNTENISETALRQARVRDRVTATVEDISDALRVILALRASHTTLTAAEIAGVTGLPHDRVSLTLRASELAGVAVRLKRQPGRLSTRWTCSEVWP